MEFPHLLEEKGLEILHHTYQVRGLEVVMRSEVFSWEAWVTGVLADAHEEWDWERVLAGNEESMDGALLGHCSGLLPHPLAWHENLLHHVLVGAEALLLEEASVLCILETQILLALGRCLQLTFVAYLLLMQRQPACQIHC